MERLLRRIIHSGNFTLILAVTTMLLPSARVASAGFPKDAVKKCATDAVVSGTACIDTYEASVWRVPSPTGSNSGLVASLRKGKASVADLTAAGAVQLGVSGDDYVPCADNGSGCEDVFAASLSGVTPSAYITWFQAQQACKNSRKRLPANSEWQAAVAGTPDPGPDDGVTDCNSASAMAAVTTGSRSACISTDGAFDMVGNLSEWVADWGQQSTSCASWNPSVSPTGDTQCWAGSSGPISALIRGGSFSDGTAAGPLATHGGYEPSDASSGIGFRCAR